MAINSDLTDPSCSIFDSGNFCFDSSNFTFKCQPNTQGSAFHMEKPGIKSHVKYTIHTKGGGSHYQSTFLTTGER